MNISGGRGEPRIRPGQGPTDVDTVHQSPM
jgi:hypothetical protein